MAARNAVDAATLARTGMQGRLDIIECPQGFAELYAGSLRTPDWLNDRQHVIERIGVMPKNIPVVDRHTVFSMPSPIYRRSGPSPPMRLSRCTVWWGSPTGVTSLTRNRLTRCRHVFHAVLCGGDAGKGALSVADFTPHAVAAQADAQKLARIAMEALGRRSRKPKIRLCRMC